VLSRFMRFFFISCCAFVLNPSVLAAEAAGPAERFAQLADDYLKGSLALSPTGATGVGYHQHTDAATGKVIELDAQLDDWSAAGLERQRAFFRTFRRRLQHEVKFKQLDLETQADYELIRDSIELNLLELDELQSFKHKPQGYVEMIGGGLFLPLVLEYAPAEKRVEHICARLEQVSAVLAAAKANLTDTAPVFLDTALEENKGNIGLIQGALKTLVPPSGPLKERYDRAAAAAVAALEDFNRWLDTELRPHATASWRLTGRLYAKKLRYALGTNLTPQEILRDAERELARVRAEMMLKALSLHADWFPGHGDHSDLAGAERENRVIREVLNRISEERAARDQLFPRVRADVADIQSFLARAKLLTLTGRENLQVIETPPFMRGVYGVAGFQPAPPLQPDLGAFFFVTPVPERWTEEQATSKLREYNNFMLKILTVHEALPGHYIQFEHAAAIEPKWRRLLRGVFGNGPYVEGWATYAQDVVVEAGYLDRDPRLALTNYKMLLRVISNSILDVRMHTGGMTDQEALDLMMNQTFQERAEAEGKLRRAQLTSTQLPSYFVGWREWWRLRHDLERKEGSRFSLAAFHDRALDAGGVTMGALRRLLQ